MDRQTAIRQAARPSRRQPGLQRRQLRLPGGAAFPAWSLVRSKRARAALDAIFAATDVERQWVGLTDEEDRLRRLILAEYGRVGRAPSVARLAAQARLDEAQVRRLLAALRDRDLVVLGDEGEIGGAYPFSERDTGHRVEVGTVRANAMCALDALGIGAMLGRDARIRARCRECGGAITASTRGRGAALATVAPRGTVVWSGIAYADGCAADSLCRVIAFFCSDRHLRAWRAAGDPDAPGFRLSPDEALQAGRAIFEPMLADGAGGRQAMEDQ